MDDKAKILVVGATRGLGHFLSTELNSMVYNRNTSKEEMRKIENTLFDMIVYCASNPLKKETDRSSELFLEQINLLKTILKLNYKKFIFISSVDVYPSQRRIWSETDNFDKENISSLYGVLKKTSEELISDSCKNFLILRCSSLLGADSVDGVIDRLKVGKSLSTKKTSRYNFITYDQVKTVILMKKLSGILNLSSSESVELSEIAMLLNYRGDFGEFEYIVPRVNNDKAKSLGIGFEKSSKEILVEFLRS